MLRRNEHALAIKPVFEKGLDFFVSAHKLAKGCYKLIFWMAKKFFSHKDLLVLSQLQVQV